MSDTDDPMDGPAPASSGAFSFAIGGEPAQDAEPATDDVVLAAPSGEGAADERVALDEDFVLADLDGSVEEDFVLAAPSGEGAADERSALEGASSWTFWLACALIAIGLLFVLWALIST